MRVRRRWFGSAWITLVIVAVATALVIPSVGTQATHRGRRVAPSRPHRIYRTGPMPPSWAAASRTDSKCWVAKSAERGFLRSTNASRERFGKRRLRLDPELSKVARKHTKEMTDRNLLHHTTNAALRRRVTFWSVLGENVGVGATVDSLHSAFMNSPAHRDNILHGSYHHVGVGTKSALGRLWVTVIFQASDNPGTTLRMPHC